MATKTPPGVVQIIGDFGNEWRLEAVGLKRVQQTIGQDLFHAFVRCFVHADRLLSLVQFAKLPATSAVPQPAERRNFLTCFWFTIGTLRELALALRQLRSALAKRGWLDLEIQSLERLHAIEKRWEDNPLYRGVRNTQSFHVDDQLIKRGIEVLVEKRHAIVLAQGSGKDFLDSSSRIGSAALLYGFDATEAEVNELLQAAYEDATAYTSLDNVFAAALGRSGVRLTRRKWVAEKHPSFV